MCTLFEGRDVAKTRSPRPPTPGPYSAVIEDLDRDGGPDVVLASGGQVSVLLNGGLLCQAGRAFLVDVAAEHLV